MKQGEPRPGEKTWPVVETDAVPETQAGALSEKGSSREAN